MINRGAPTDYFAAKDGPVALAAFLIFSLVATFIVKLL